MVKRWARGNVFEVVERGNDRLSSGDEDRGAGGGDRWKNKNIQQDWLVTSTTQMSRAFSFHHKENGEDPGAQGDA